MSPLDPHDGNIDCKPDGQPDKLVKLKSVCRRFRRIVNDGSLGLWDRVALRDPNDAAVDALAKLPWKARKAVRMPLLEHTTISVRKDVFNIDFSVLSQLQSLRSLTLADERMIVDAKLMTALASHESLEMRGGSEQRASRVALRALEAAGRLTMLSQDGSLQDRRRWLPLTPMLDSVFPLQNNLSYTVR
eukprot:tig00000760_g3936.t1